MTTAEIIEDLRERLRVERARSAMLAARLGLKTGEIEGGERLPVWAKPLTASETALMMALLSVYPRTLSKYELDELTPKRDHVRDRDLKVVEVFMSKVRRKLGDDVIENVWGRGWRCSDEFHKQYGFVQ